MSNQPKFQTTAYWNGHKTAIISACIVKPIANTEKPMFWYNAFAGQERQAIEIQYEGQKWLIDNNTGQAYEKVTKGMGCPPYGHKSLGSYEFVRYIDEADMIVGFNALAEARELERIDEYQRNNCPEDFAKKERMVAAMRLKIGTP